MTSIHTPQVRDETSPPGDNDPTAFWLHDTALELGAEAAVAQEFARTGQLRLNDVLLCVQPRSDEPDDWLALARIERPLGVDHERWCQVLLDANGSLMLLAPWTFTIDDEGAALLVLRVPPSHFGDAVMLCGSLFGLLCTAEGLVQGLVEPQAAASPPAGATAGARSTANEDAAAIGAAIKASMAQPAFTAPMQALVRHAVKALGGDEAAQRQVIEQCSLRVGPVDIAVVADIEGHALVLSADFGPDAITGARDAAAVLAGNLDLLGLAGLAMGRLAGRVMLLGRWDVDEAPDDGEERAALFAAWLIDFAELSQAIGAAATAGRRHSFVGRRSI
ncbi:hypothetical protein J2W49_001911 [Hydrogenophaga palleronii]|uniref:Uncharacterized protein n=1 Tax=Hydrogenophaga palleronii TaxID=65655 RepID=A0ABU1WLS1_9BURK|nr:hypothetical protein [Hydrogenophaga palleronii]MDR7149956.1 hypothetical protein [Hydrogenophaga palleronii]